MGGDKQALKQLAQIALKIKRETVVTNRRKATLLDRVSFLAHFRYQRGWPKHMREAA